jgi:hypothetical protein
MLMTIIASSRSGKNEVPARRTTTVRRRLATAAFVASAVIVGVFGWRWVLVEATTDYGPADPVAAEPARPVSRHAPPPVGVEVTVLDIHTASPASPTATPAKARPAPSSRPRPLSKSAH